MIYTVTLNPALDYIVTMDEFKMGLTNRTTSEQMLSGGKGINVSILLNNLGIKSTALGFVAGFTGEKIANDVEAQGIKTDFVKVDGYTRINVKLKDYDGTEINGAGPKISSSDISALYKKLDVLKAGDIVFLSGSIPKSVPDTIYCEIMKRYPNVEFVVDATKDLLLNSLEFHPFLIKPNNHELGEIFGVEINNHGDALKYAAKLQERGSKNVLVSMGGKGAALVDAEGNTHFAPAPEGKLVNAVGAGDSMLAGFVAGYLEYHKYSSAFKMGLAAGSASAFTDGFATKEEIYNLLNT